MSTPTSGPRSSNSHRRRQMPVVAIVLVVVGMLVLFGAGFGLTRIIQGSNSGGGGASGGSSSGASNSTDNPQPCVTVTVTPGAGLPSTAQVTTNVYNATDRAGLAASTAEQLQVRGFVIGTIANDPLSKTITASAEIRHGPSGERSARLMSLYIPGSVLVNDGRKDATIDTVLGAGFTAVAPQSQVDAAMTAPSPSASGPGCPSPTAPVPAPTGSPSLLTQSGMPSESTTPSESASQ